MSTVASYCLWYPNKVPLSSNNKLLMHSTVLWRVVFQELFWPHKSIKVWWCQLLFS